MYTFGILLCICGVALCRPNESLVVSSTTEPPKETTTIGNTQIQNQDDADTAPKVPKIYEMRVDTNVSNRFATTLVTSKVKNLAKTAQEATFSVVLPETAYISKFVMVINDKSYEAYVKEKEEAKQIYDQAVQSGQAAAHVEANARDSNRFTVSVNVEPQSKATFKLTYEELLQRRNEKYEIVLNIHPGQPVKDLIVEVNIAETRPLKFVKAPPLRSGNEINKNDGAEPQDPQAEIINVNSTSAVVKFTPNIEKQKQLAKGLGTKEENGLAGQFIVQYDVERDSEGGEILVKDGYFVHFFAPSELKPLPKHVVFVLDTSGSMDGIRIQQLKEAMNSILAELKPEDIFNIVEFSSTVKVWNVEEGKVKYEAGSDPWGYYPNPNSDATTTAKPTEKDLPTATKASEDNLKKAKDVVGQLNAFGGTDIKSALEVGLQLVKKNKQDKNDTHQPLIVFLTDGEPTVGETNTDKIISSVHEFNSGSIRSPIFSLSFGDGADREFLQKISLRNLGFARHIYEAADASLQLEEFYRQISSPLLSNVTFKYVSNVTQLTKTVFPIFFHGSELCVAGYAPVDPSNTDFVSDVTGRGILGPIKLIPKVVENPLGALERLWAYLTVKQILEARDAADNKTRYTQKALDLALKYSFVTPVTSLVVVKPNETSAVSTEDASKSGSPNFGGFHLQSQFAAVPGLPLPSPPQDVQPQYPQTSSFNAADLVIAARPAVISATYKPQSFTTPYHTSTRPGTTITSTTTSSPSVSSSSISSSTISSSTTTSSTTDSSDEYEALRKILPWLNNILGQNGILTSPPGDLKLGTAGDLKDTVTCSETPVNGTSGICTALSACSEVYALLTDQEIFAKYVCTIEKIAGICCPKPIVP